MSTPLVVLTLIGFGIGGVVSHPRPAKIKRIKPVKPRKVLADPIPHKETWA